MMISTLRRTQFGRSSEQLDAMIDQLQLSLEELEVSQAEVTSVTEPAPRTVLFVIKTAQVPILHIEFKWIKPSVWRRVAVPENITLSKLHQVIQAVFGWSDTHLHEF